MAIEETECSTCSGTGKVPTPASLRKLRNGAGWTLKRCAKAWKFSITYLSDVERGKRNATAEIVGHYYRSFADGC